MKRSWGKDSPVPLMHHDPADLELICLVKKCKICFGFKNSNLDFPKEMHPYVAMLDCS